MGWVQELFRVGKPIIGMCHLPPLPGDPRYEPAKGMAWAVEKTGKELRALLLGGVNGIMIANESSRPYMVETERIVSVSMSRIIGELRTEISVPFGISVLWDAQASIDIAVATEAQFVRGAFTGVYGSDFGLWNTRCGELLRHRHRLHGDHIKLMFLVPEAAGYLGQRAPEDVIRSMVFNAEPDALCISGLIAGAETSSEKLRAARALAPSTPVFINTGLNHANVSTLLPTADGGIVGTAFKCDGDTWADTDETRVRALMDQVQQLSKSSM